MSLATWLLSQLLSRFMRVSPHRLNLAHPFAAQHGEDHVVDPLAAEVVALAMVRLLTHAEASTRCLPSWSKR